MEQSSSKIEDNLIYKVIQRKSVLSPRTLIKKNNESEFEMIN